MRVGMGMREPEDLSSAATDPPYRTSRHEPPEQQSPGAQPDEVQDEEIHVAGDKRRRHDQGDHRRRPDPLSLPPRPLLGGLGCRVAHRFVGRPDGQPDERLTFVITTPAEQPPVWQCTSMPLPSGRCLNASPSDLPP